jgi:hypothetical protein
MTPGRLVGLSSLACLVALAAGPAARAAQPRFYLSTDRSFSPDDEGIAVQLEARGLEHLDFRLYRIPEPEAFFRDQEDLHRVATDQGPARANSLEVWREVRHQLARRLWQTRDSLSGAARRTGRQVFSEGVDELEEESRNPPAPETSVGLLKGFEAVDVWRQDLRGGGEWTYLEVPLGVRAPGVYLVEGVHGSEVGYTVAVISRLALLTRQSQDRFLVQAVEPRLGAPVAGVQVVLWGQGKEIGRGKTDEAGVWEKQIPLLRATRVFAQRGADFALLDPTYHPANLVERKVYLSTDRPVYRPGHEVHWKGLVRDARDERYRLPEGIARAQVEARDPNGLVVWKGEAPVSPRGSFHGGFRLAESAALGTYRLVASLGGQQHAGEFKVKATRKPEYRVLVKPDRRAAVSGSRVQVEVGADYFFGPPVPGAKVKVAVHRTRFYVPWWVDAEYAWYYSEGEYRSTLRETLVEKEARLDAKGRYHFDFETLPDSLDYTYGIEASVVDAAGQAVTGHASVRVTRAEFRLELLPEALLTAPGGQARVKVQTRDFAGQPVPAEVELVVRAGQVGAGGQVEEREVHRQKLATGPRGEGWLEFPATRGGAYQVEGSARDARGQVVEARAVVYVTSQGGDLPAEPSELELLADRRSYRVGDKARFLVLSPHADASLLVTLEGGRLYRHQVVRARGHSAVVEFPVEEAQAPNFFVRAATVFDGQLLERRLDVVVPPREKLLQVAVSPDRSPVEPGQPAAFTVEVKDHQGRPVAGAEVCLAVVDEAIYGLSPEIAIPIERFFYHRKRNDVRASCSLDFRFYGYGVDQKERMAALHLRQPVVPGSFKALASIQVRKDFKDTLAWHPVLATDAQGRARVEFVVPDNLTAWRATARAVSDDTRVGEGTGSLRVAKPVVIRLAGPSHLLEGDRASLGALVHNYTEAERVFQVRLESGSPALAIEEGQPASLKIPAGGLAMATWRARAAAPGEGVLRLVADGGDGARDALESRIPVRRYGLEQVLLSAGALDDRRPEAEFSFQVPEEAAGDSVRLAVSLSSGVAPALLASLEYLAGYPYGCTEQTLSRFLPDLVVARALDELGLEHPGLKQKLPEYIHAGLSRLKVLQHQDGGWGWWEGDATDPFMTAYAVHGLAMARRLGWAVDEDMLNRGSNRLQALVRDARLSPTGRAYLLYGLSLAGVKYESMLEKLLERPGELSDYGRALVGLALHELGRREPAERLAAELELAVARSPDQGGAAWGQEDGPGWERDPVESTAAVLRVLLQSRPASPRIPEAVRWLMAAREEDRWQSTRDTAMAVYALVDYLKRDGAGELEAEVSAALDGAPAARVSLGRAELLKPSVSLVADAPGRTGPNAVSLGRQGKGVVFYQASARFFGRQADIPAQGERLRVQRRLLKVSRRLEGDLWRFSLSPLSGAVRPGDELLVELSLEAAQDTDYVMLEDPLPGGVQPLEQDQGYELPGVELRQPGLHREVRDTQVAFFLGQLRKGSRKLAYLVRAAVPGEYRLLPARVLPMYDPRYAGNSAGGALEIAE